MKLCKTYEAGLNNSDREIRMRLDRDRFPKGHYVSKEFAIKWGIMPRNYEIKELRDELSPSQLASIKEEARTKFAGIKTFIEAQMNAYKAAHGQDEHTHDDSSGIFGDL